MSLTSKQINELRAYAKDRKGELAKLITDAADTIEMLSTKLHASQMARSSQYYHGGWIPCSERLPEERQEILATTTDNAWGDVVIIRNYYKEMHKSVIAWMPLPEAYREGER